VSEPQVAQLHELDETPSGNAALPPAVPAIQRGARLYRRAAVVRASRGPAVDWRGLRILCYHRVSPERDVLSVPPARFRQQLEHALASGATPLRLVDALARGACAQRSRSFCVTFDDGYEDTLSEALPILRELAVPATVYVPTAIIGGTARLTWYQAPPPMLDWAGIDELRADGLVDIGAHTRTHPALTRLDEEAARSEIAGSRAELAVQLGEAPTTFAYPAGLYGERERRLVAEAGFTSAVTVRAGVNGAGADPLELARTLVYGEEPLATFAARFDGKLDVQTRLRSFVLNRSRAKFFRIRKD
jgi:peptidoglycan/xylan/chitin deacetylase (PgdA/CDA1 family)